MSVSITLQSTIGGFSAEFMRKLPAVERAIGRAWAGAIGFVISKDRAASASVAGDRTVFYDYTSVLRRGAFYPSPSKRHQVSEYFYQR